MNSYRKLEYLNSFNNDVEEKIGLKENTEMSVEVIAVGGYEEAGKNMTAIKIGGDNVIFDRGTQLDQVHINGARRFTRAHVSGHASREDHRDFIRMLNAKHLIPGHGNLEMFTAYTELAEEEGYKLGRYIQLLHKRQAQVFNGTTGEP